MNKQSPGPPKMGRSIIRNIHRRRPRPGLPTRRNASTSSSAPPTPGVTSVRRISWLDLRRRRRPGSDAAETETAPPALSVLERLVLEEALLRHDPLRRCWGVVGTHHPSSNGLIDLNSSHPSSLSSSSSTSPPLHGKEDCCVVLGIGGKPADLLDLDRVRRDGPLVIRRFSGGGTVVVDQSSLLTTFIVRNDVLPEVAPYPRDIMKWSADAIFRPAFDAMKSDLPPPPKNEDDENGEVDVSPPPSPPPEDFVLHENDYALGRRKVGGNAQAIVKGGWLHHTSLLWDYDDSNMDYLTLPSKRPAYRGDRSHDEFLVRLRDCYRGGGDDGGGSRSGPGEDYVFDRVRRAAEVAFDEVEEVSLEEALDVVNDELGGMQDWFDGKCRTKIVTV